MGTINLTASNRLAGSGHYAISPDGRLRSVHFASLQRSERRPSLAYPPLIAGNVKDIIEGTDPAYGHSTGLRNSVRIEEGKSPPIYVFDNHHFAYFAWHEALAMGYISKGAILIHIDRHNDEDNPNTRPASKNLCETADYVREKLSIYNFIQPAIASGLIGEFYFFYATPYLPLSLATRASLYTQKNRDSSLEEIIARTRMPKKLILDVDLDAFVGRTYSPQEMPTEKNFAEPAKIIARIAEKAGVVTIATSPSFTHEGTVVLAARRIVREIISSPV